jgi:hypothetical protein
MSEPLDVDPSALVHNGDQLGQIGTELKRNSAGLFTAIKGLGPFGGDDSFGRMFHSVFDPTRDTIRETGDGMGDYASGGGDHLHETGASYKAVNQFNDESIHPVSDVTNLP